MKKIPKFEKRFKEAIEDPIFNLAKELFTEGYTEKDVSDNIKAYPCLPEPRTLQLRNYMRDIDIEILWNNRGVSQTRTLKKIT